MDIACLIDNNEKSPAYGLFKLDNEKKIRMIADTSDEHGNTLLHDLAKNDRRKLMEETISLGYCNLNKRNNLNLTALDVAVLNRNMTIARMLLDAGATHQDVFEESTEQEFFFKLLSLCEKFVDASRNKLEDNKLTLLHMTTLMGSEVDNCVFIKALIKNGANVNARSKRKRIPLHYACIIGDEELVKLFLDEGSEVDAQDESGWTPLMWAADKNFTRIMELLLQAGADINHSSNVTGVTCMHLAAKARNAKLIDFLLDHAAKLECREYNTNFDPVMCLLFEGNSVGTYTVVHQRKKKQVQDFDYFLIFGRKRDKDGSNLARCLEILLLHGARVDFELKINDIPVIYEALDTKSYEVLEILFRVGGTAHFDYKDSSGQEDEVNAMLVKHVALFDALNKKELRPRNFVLEDSSFYYWGFKDFYSLKDFYSMCEDELKLMKETFCSESNFTYFDIFDDKRASAFYRNENLRRDLEWGNISLEFNIYKDLITQRMSEITEKEMLIDKAKSKLKPILQKHNAVVPSIFEKICSYLDVCDMRRLSII